ncbi:hypothetical protein A2331_03310 [Candidatus Falkowbacteria bacterium RIFOXYB2_FULL_34_18]|uniref:Uncharacterized protein n=1 Tax=Candidatus Falkowbacteria bacterium RIFOXYD2_FULL_34_120 TaxID=1798007 RepID=A0A1F5TNJ4_9BACT|nr:MAG: hypothetical protein A2331_03310 [Candidatus Falkowbacteria bacterium RIFOXYB2_FULL_34_18]OGF28951.1 MAG: hypothetical protein A2500_01750 [Candidatus Falkowbacteria bacterium RIFOXYC12_FULL_34_55]OGF35850.1 MAG: hypothetical protein A2466_03630 [Candidatus Falkowbacteria bacterium RIFOXYC2_FULL_34_220]OGF38457.1 MAG: hypothetical protein A2515_07000 [Candidatus Falkowbacteria bacterium RIFOXYD12_FULL_34_57]OGF40523.1 MAG: hypothetical protein A2531_04415 [Candidatus Falkowbacteria bact
MNVTKDKKFFEKITSVLLIIFISVLIMAGLAYALRGYVGVKKEKNENKEKSINVDKENEKMIIGGDKDEGECLIGAGYSWCKIKNKCLRIWEEPCIAEDVQSLVEAYLKNNISELSPEKEVLGGKFYITKFRFIDDGRVVIDYEDGHIALGASVLFAIKDGKVVILEFSPVSVNGFNPEKVENNNSAIAELTLLFSEKYNKEENNIIVQITDDRGMYLRGYVKFSLDEDAPGGYFLAKIVDGKYKIIADGNGQIDCNLVSDFPEDMIDDCAQF